MTDNRTTKLREKLTERGMKYRTNEVHGMPVTLYESGGLTWSVTDHPNGYLVANCVNLTPEQAIAATLVSEREKQLELLVNQLWYLVNHQSGYGYAAALESIEELGIEVDDD